MEALGETKHAEKKRSSKIEIERDREERERRESAIFHFLSSCFVLVFVHSRKPVNVTVDTHRRGMRAGAEERNCTVYGENTYFDRARCAGCKEHVGKLLQKAAADSGKRNLGEDDMDVEEAVSE